MITKTVRLQRPKSGHSPFTLEEKKFVSKHLTLVQSWQSCGSSVYMLCGTKKIANFFLF